MRGGKNGVEYSIICSAVPYTYLSGVSQLQIGYINDKGAYYVDTYLGRYVMS